MSNWALLIYYWVTIVFMLFNDYDLEDLLLLFNVLGYETNINLKAVYWR